MPIENLPKCERAYIAALLQLMKKKPFTEITITELAKKADYDRKTFYRHFDSKEEVLKRYCAVILEEMADLQAAMGQLTFRSGILSYFRFWENQLEFLQLLKKSGMLYFFEERHMELIYEHVGRKIQPEIPETLQKASDFSRYAAYFTYGGLWTVLIEWIAEKPRKSPEEITEQLLDYLQQAGQYIEESA